MKQIVVSAVLVTLAFGGVVSCSSSSEGAAGDNLETAPTTTVVAAPTTKPQSPTDIFTAELRSGGILPTPDQVPLLIPAAVGNCDVLTSTTLPASQKYAKMVELSRTLGQGKNIFDQQSTSEAFMNASIRAYCPQFESLIPA